MQLNNDSIGSLITEIGHAINANNGSCSVIEEALTKSLDLALKSERLFAVAREFRRHAVSPEGERYYDLYIDARDQFDAVIKDAESQD